MSAVSHVLRKASTSSSVQLKCAWATRMKFHFLLDSAFARTLLSASPYKSRLQYSGAIM